MNGIVRGLIAGVCVSYCAVTILASSSVPLQVWVEQNGVPVAIENRRAAIDRAPFDLVVTAAKDEAVLVRVSSSPSLLERARSGKPLDRTFKPGQSLSELPLNPDQDVMVDSPETQHAWWYRGIGDHRCSSAEEIEGGYRCTRKIANLVFQNPFVRPLTPLRTQKAIDHWMANRPKPWSVPVEFAGVDQLNFVFLTGESQGMDSTKEKERAVLQLDFRNPPRKAFKLELKQNGRQIPVVDHQVDLRREPFDLVFDIYEGDRVLVHSSLDPPVFDLAEKGHWLGKTFKRLSTYALSLSNESETLRLSDSSANHGAWTRYDESRHSFTSLEESDGVLHGLVRISNIALGDNSISVSDFGPSSLYVVLYAGDLSTDESGGRELQREWFKIRFSD